MRYGRGGRLIIDRRAFHSTESIKAYQFDQFEDDEDPWEPDFMQNIKQQEQPNVSVIELRVQLAAEKHGAQPLVPIAAADAPPK